VLPVLGTTRKSGVVWLRVMLPGRPDGHVGWIRQQGARLSKTHWHLVVETSKCRLLVYDAGRLVKTFSAIVGKPSTPTPLGQFFVEEEVTMPATAPGAPYALALSARSRVFKHFDGGPGQIAIHGIENLAGRLGEAVSHGCVRVSTRAVSWLVAAIAPGVPVTIEK
jgi:lipoprotein-anchoring transpeptidase ErfK/SrfK